MAIFEKMGVVWSLIRTTKKMKKLFESLYVSISEFYIYYLTRYII
jgi:hypothetical protein